MIRFCFDEYYRKGDNFVFKISDDNRSRPIIYFWITKAAVLGYKNVEIIGANDSSIIDGRFVYVSEMHWELPDWCKKSEEDPLLSPAQPILDALKERRAIILISYAQEGRTHFKQEEEDEISVFDKLEDLSEELDLLPDQLWFVTGNLDAKKELELWKQARKIIEPSFILRTCEISTFGIGRIANECYYNSRGLAHMTTGGFAFEGQKCISWKETKISLVERKFTAPRLGEVGKLPDPKFNYGCLSRNFRFHRWWALERLYREGILEKGLVSFPKVTAYELSLVFREPIPADLVDLVESLPRFIDVEWITTSPNNFNAQNIAAVTLPPDQLNRDCAFELVNETSYDGTTLVTEKTIKALYGRGAFAVNGPQGVIEYLNSLGVETWSNYFDESYDQVEDEIELSGQSKRFGILMDSIIPIISDDSRVRKLCKSLASQRDRNFKWLIEAEKPWDRLISELEGAVSDL